MTETAFKAWLSVQRPCVRLGVGIPAEFLRSWADRSDEHPCATVDALREPGNFQRSLKEVQQGFVAYLHLISAGEFPGIPEDVRRFLGTSQDLMIPLLRIIFRERPNDLNVSSFEIPHGKITTETVDHVIRLALVGHFLVSPAKRERIAQEIDEFVERLPYVLVGHEVEAYVARLLELGEYPEAHPARRVLVRITEVATETRTLPQRARETLSSVTTSE